MCYWGNGTVGKILTDDSRYAAEYKIRVTNDNLRDEVVDFIKQFNWRDYKDSVSMKGLSQQDILNVLKKNIKNIK